jgi:hypothetical protein
MPPYGLIGLLALGLAVLGVELLLRLADRALPPPQHWYDPVAQYKDDDLRALVRRERLNVLYTGTSMMFDAVDPSRVADVTRGGWRGYNCGINLTTLSGQLPWIQRLLSVAGPVHVVHGLASLDLNDRGGPQARAREAYLRSRRLSASRRTQLLVLLERRCAAVRHRALLRRPRRLLRAARAAWRGQTHPSAVGPYGVDVTKAGAQYRCSDGFRRAFRNNWLADFQIGPGSVAALEELILALKPDLTLVLMPTTDDYLEMHSCGGEAVEETRRTVLEVASRHGVLLLEPPGELRHARLFADPVHCNDVGQRMFSDWLAHALKDRVGSSPPITVARPSGGDYRRRRYP